MKQEILDLRQQLQTLQSRHEAGTLDAAAHASAKAPLERRLLDLVLADPGPDADTAGLAALQPRPSTRLVALLSAAVLALAVAGYSYTGAPGATMMAAGADAPAAATASSPAEEEAQFAAAVEQLEQRLKSDPGNSEGWAMLARSYARLGKHELALPAFQKTGALLDSDARLLADYADTAAMLNNRSLLGEPMRLIDKALQIDPDNFKALALAGTGAYEAKDYRRAVRHWERLAGITPPSSEFMPQLQASLADARRLGGLPASTLPNTAPAAGPAELAGAAVAAAPGASAAAVSSVRVQGQVRLSPALARQVQPGDTVFIFARAAEGPRMPLAILRHQVKDLPLSFTLDDSQAMSPAMRLSMHSKVVISARVSKSGQAVPTAGDLVGQTAAVTNTSTGLVVEINEVVKN